MGPVELQNPDLARRFVTQGLWLQGVAKPTAGTVRSTLAWALAAADRGTPLLPVGVIADLSHAALGADRPARRIQPVPGWPPALARGYEDHVLGKVYADWSFE